MAAWTTDEWDTFCAIVDEAWPKDFDDRAAAAWRVLLDSVDPKAAVRGVTELMLEGHEWRPSCSTVLAAARRDPSRPTFDETCVLIFGPGGILAARAPAGRHANAGAMAAAHAQAALDRSRAMHPVVGAFVRAQGLERLRGLGIDDPEWGEKRRSDLEKRWQAFIDSWDGREVAALAAGDSDQLRRLDPLAALGAAGIKPPAQLEQGKAA